MNIREALLKKHSKEIATLIGKWIGTNKDRMDEFVKLLLQGDFLTTQRAAWVLGFLDEKQASLVEPFLPEIIEKMMRPETHGALKRNMTRLLQYIKIPESVHAGVMNVCFELLADPEEAIAVRCFSMTVLLNLSKIYPEIKQELRLILEHSLVQESSAGFQNRAMKTMKEL